MLEINLSPIEQKLLDYITTQKVTTINKIETDLGKQYLGALGRLLNLKLIENEKRIDKTDLDNDLNRYGHKRIKCYFVKEKE